MPRWNNNPVDVSLGIKIYDAGGYRLKIETLKPFVNALKAPVPGPDGVMVTPEITGGVRAVCKILAAPDARDVGATYIANLYQHNEGGQSFSKGFIVPVYGFPANKEGQEQFDAVAKDLDWTVDTDAQLLGEGWNKMQGKEVNAELSIGIDNKGNQQQKAKYMPI